MKRFFFILPILAISFCAAAEPEEGDGSNAPSANVIDQAALFAPVHQLMAQGEWQEAEAALQGIAQNPAADAIEIAFLGGLIALETGNYAIAIERFKIILASHPDIPRVRLELARAYFMLEDDDAARHHFEHVLSDGVPDDVAATVQGFLDQITARRDWQAGFSFALMPDSNVNQSTSSQTINIGGLPFVLSSDAKQTGGMGMLLLLYGEKRWHLTDGWRLVGNGNLTRRDYSKSQFDDTTLYTRLGPRYLFEDAEIGMGLSLSRRWLGNRAYNHAGGLFVDGSKQLNAQWGTALSAEWQYYGYDATGSLPGSVVTTAARLRYAPDAENLIEGALDLTQDNTVSATMRHDTLGGILEYRGVAPWDLLYGVSLRKSYSHFNVFDTFHQQARGDWLTSVTLDVTKRDWKFAGFSPLLSITHIDNRSSIPLFSFRRNLMLIGANRPF